MTAGMAQVPLPRERTVPNLLSRCVARYGDKPFLHFRDRVFGYRDLDRLAARAAQGFQALGVGKGDMVGIMMANKPEYLALWFGLGRIGAVEVPLNTAHRSFLLSYMLDKADCKALAIDAELVPQVLAVIGALPKLAAIVVFGGDPPAGAPAGKCWHRWDEVMANPGDPAPVDVAWNDPFAIMFTSGTTGPSKGAVMPHNYAWVMAEMVAAAGSYGENDCLYNALPLFHGNAQVLSTAPALLSGARMVLAEKFSASAFWDEVRRHGCTEFNYIGTILSVLMKAEPSPSDRDHPLRLMLGGGAGPGLFEAFEQRFGVTLIEGYGMSEIGLPLMASMTERKVGTCGRPAANYEVRLVDDDGLPVPPDTPGELLVRPKQPWSMLLGYHDMPDKTVEAWRDLWFHTGDYLSVDADGWYVFVDRKKDALRRRGENISSFEVERILLGHPEIAEVAAIPARSELGEDEVMICVVRRPDSDLAADALARWCEGTMAAFMVPRYIRFLDALPKTPTARVEKYKLRQDGITADTWDRGDGRR